MKVTGSNSLSYSNICFTYLSSKLFYILYVYGIFLGRWISSVYPFKIKLTICILTNLINLGRIRGFFELRCHLWIQTLWKLPSCLDRFRTFSHSLPSFFDLFFTKWSWSLGPNPNRKYGGKKGTFLLKSRLSAWKVGFSVWKVGFSVEKVLGSRSGTLVERIQVFMSFFVLSKLLPMTDTFLQVLKNQSMYDPFRVFFALKREPYFKYFFLRGSGF